MLLRFVACCGTLQDVSMLQYVAVCYSALQSVIACRSVLQYVSVEVILFRKCVLKPPKDGEIAL